jgi:hypothetical protein
MNNKPILRVIENTNMGGKSDTIVASVSPFTATFTERGTGVSADSAYNINVLRSDEPKVVDSESPSLMRITLDEVFCAALLIIVPA